ncbi:MAG: Macrolide export ATP-binding/permease protein MacB [Tenericutes bacterium ADurb.Bin087]|nr:MAG: Macrolide export ATP-binding/permease protein MacB [Tenericutes bacterium ADurb.Bin087]
MLELVNIKRYYTQKKGPTVKALDDVSLVFPETGMVFVLGKSGSGKSTLLNVIGGLDQATGGDLLIKGKSTKKFKQDEYDSYRNTMVGFIFQEYNILNDFTVGQNIGIALELQGLKASNEKINEILNILDMQGYAHRKPNTLSGGQKQRVAIARALVKNPQIIMADEPTGALDSATGKQLFETLKKLSKDKLVIVVTHDHEFAENYGDRIIEFSDGKVIRDVSKEKNEAQELKTVFSEEGITVTAGYELTTEDLAKINEYLRQNRNKTLIKVLNNDYEFKDTIQPQAYPKTEKLELIKSKMPFKSALKIGASALKHKTGRLVLSIILASTAFSMFGLTDAMASFKRTQSTINTMLDLDIKYSTISKYERIKSPYDDSWTYTRNLRLEDEDLIELQKIDEELEFFPAVTIEYSYTNNFDERPEYGFDLYNFGIGSLVTLTAADLNTAHLTLLAGELPTVTTEAAVPEYVYQGFKKYGYVNAAGFKYKIEKPEDLVGKKLNEQFTITGVFATQLDIERFTSGDTANNEEDLIDYVTIMQIREYLASGFHTSLLVHPSVFNMQVEFNRQYQVPIDSYVNLTSTDYIDLSIYLNRFDRIETLALRDDVVLFNDDITLDNLAPFDIVLSANAYMWQDIPGGLNDSVEAAKNQFIAMIVGTADNDAAIENMLREYYTAYGFASPDDVPAYTTWTGVEQTKYRTYYANELLTTFYDTNPFQPALTGKNQISPLVNARIKNDFDPFSVSFNLASYSGDELNKTLRVVGFTFDYLRFNYAWEDISIFIQENDAPSLRLSRQGAYDLAITYHGNSRTLITKLVNLNNDLLHQKEGLYYRTNNEVSSMINFIGEFIEIISRLFVVAGVIFAIFAALLLLNFITLSVAFKKQEIGILRAIGARGIDVSSIFMNEAGIIASINLIVALIVAIIGARVINHYVGKSINFYLSFINVGLRQFALLILIAFGVAFISSFIPVFRLSRKKPIDAIRMR